MFTGIVEETGIIVSKKTAGASCKFRVRAKSTAKKLALSDSISINGVCHTVTAKSKNEFEFTSVRETLKKTALGALKEGDEVNLEGSLTLNKKIGGHFVFGHVDDTGEVISIIRVKSKNKERSDNWEYRFKINKKHYPFVIYVGSIAINGVSLTIAEVTKPKGGYFEIKTAIIPYTYHHTIFKNLKLHDKVNLEFDFLGKYVMNILSANPKIKKLIK